jgi:methionine-rich copper-binding protein CopC
MTETTINCQAQLVAETLDEAAARSVVARFAERFGWDVQIETGPETFTIDASDRTISVDVLGLASAMQIGPAWATDNVEWAARAMTTWVASIKPDISQAAWRLGWRVVWAQDGSPTHAEVLAQYRDPADHDRRRALLFSTLATKQATWQQRAANAVRATCVR